MTFSRERDSILKVSILFLLFWLLLTVRMASLLERDSKSTQTGHAITNYRANPSIHTCRVHNETYILPESPWFALIGVQKSGTTALARYLADHPHVLDTRKPGAEPHFFDNAFKGLLQWYKEGKYASERDFYCEARQKYAQWYFQADALRNAAENNTLLVSFDKTPSYIHLQGTAEHLSKTCPWLRKAVVILRNPVDRAYSQYRMNIVDGSNHKKWGTFAHHVNEELAEMHATGLIGKPPVYPALPDFSHTHLNISLIAEEAAFYKLKGRPLLRKGLYAIQLRQWLHYFSHPHNLLVLNFDDFRLNPREAYHRILQHVGLPIYDLPQGYENLRAGSYEPLDPDMRRFLSKFFAPYNRRLRVLLGKEWQGVWESS